MPFTFSHPAIVLPLKYLPKKWISMTALVAGSVVPDFEYFIRLNAVTRYSHTWKGILWFDLPLAILLTFIFHLIVRNILIDNLPGFLSKRLGGFKRFDWPAHFRNNIPVIIICIIIGAASHLLWDGFTHEKGMFVNNIPQLNQTFDIAGRSVHYYSLLQYGCTVIGGFVILFALLSFPKDNNYKANGSIIPFWMMVGAVTVIAVLVRIFAGLGTKVAANLIAATFGGICAGILIISFLKGIEYDKE